MNSQQERFEVKLTPDAVIIRWWPWGKIFWFSPSFVIAKRLDSDDPNKILPAEILGGPVWEQPRPVKWVNDLIGALMYAADYAEKLDAMIQAREDFLALAVHKEPAQYYLHHPNIIGALTFPLEITTVTDERTKEAGE